MAKYRDLTLYLDGLGGDVWDATFDEVEHVVGMPLPGSARRHRPWWANQGHAQSAAWLAAGWKTANVDIEREKVTFVRAGEDAAPSVRKLTIAEAKAGLAANYGVPVEAVEVTIRG